MKYKFCLKLILNMMLSFAKFSILLIFYLTYSRSGSNIKKIILKMQKRREKMKKKNQVIVDVEALNGLLNQRFFNYTDLAEKSGINYNTLIRIKRTGHSSVRTVRVLSKALKVSPHSIAEIKSEG